MWRAILEHNREEILRALRQLRLEAWELAAQALQSDEAQGLDLRSWDLAFCGAEPIQRSTVEDFLGASAAVLPGLAAVLLTLGAPARADQRTHPARVDGGQPAGLLQHHGEVVAVAQARGVVAPPAQFHGLAFGGFPGHAFGFFQDAQRQPRAQHADVVDQRAQAQQAGVEAR